MVARTIANPSASVFTVNPTTEVAADIAEQISLDFPVGEVTRGLRQIVEATKSTRVQRCVVFASRGHSWYFDFLCRMCSVDYRDVIMAAEYERLGTRLYDFNRPIGEQAHRDFEGERPQQADGE